ncbi:MAG: tetratricopeptide repeat protein [Thermoanaerobaculia bacterium]
MDTPAPDPERARRRGLKKPKPGPGPALVLLLAALLCAAVPLAAQESARLEAEAKRLFEAAKFKEAGQMYEKAAKAADVAADHKPDLHLESAWAHFISGNSKTATEGLKAAYAGRPTLHVPAEFYSPDFARLALAVRAEVSGASNQPAPDLAELKRAAREKFNDGKIEDALYDLKRAEPSSDPQIHRLLAEAYGRLGRTAEADAARRRATDLERGLVTSSPIGPAAPAAAPTQIPGPAASIGPLLDAADRALKEGDFRGAQTMAAKAIEIDPKSSEAHRIAGDAALPLSQDADAEREYTAATVLDAGNARAEFGLARLSEKQKRWNTAASHYRRSLELNSKSVPAALGLGRSMDELKDRTAARLAYGRAIEIDPASAEAHNDFGVFLFRSGETERAVEDLIEAVRLAPTRAVFHENLGCAYRKKGMKREAEREFADASRLAPNDLAIWTALGLLRWEQKRPDEAATAYESAFNLDPKSEEAGAGLSVALMEAGKLVEAENALTRALEARPDSALLWNNLGVVRTRRGAYAPAVEAFQKALTIDAGLEAAKTNLTRARELYAIDRAVW